MTRMGSSWGWWRAGLSALAVLAVVASLGCTRMGTASAAEGGILGVTKESPGAASIALTPKQVADGKLFVDIQVTTHTINDLDKYDLTKVVSLEAGGQKVAPSSAPKLHGHHNSGQLAFPLAALPKSFSIKFEGFDQPARRVMSWP